MEVRAALYATAISIHFLVFLGTRGCSACVTALAKEEQERCSDEDGHDTAGYPTGDGAHREGCVVLDRMCCA